MRTLVSVYAGFLASCRASPDVAPPPRSGLDSIAVATVIANAIRPHIPTSGLNRGAIMDHRPSSALASAEWNRLVGAALRRIDSTIFLMPTTVYTTRLNIVRVDVNTDSLVVRLAVTTCRDTPRGVMFGGAGYDYVFRRAGARWMLESNRARGNGDGYCEARPRAGQITGADSIQIIELIAAEVRRDFPVLATGDFVRDSVHGKFGRFAHRVIAVVRPGDPAPSFPVTRLTPRVSISDLRLAGDTAVVDVLLRYCREATGAGSFHGTGTSYGYVRAGSTWQPIANRLIEQGTGSGCPW